MISLIELLDHRVEEVLQTPLLRQATISYTRNLFCGGAPIGGCDSSVRNYFRRLQIEGLATQTKLENAMYKLKKDIVIVHNGQSYNSSTMTDAIAEDYLKRFPAMEKHFIIEKDEEPAVPKKPRGKKK